jgi:hypothetical protein
MKSLHRLLFFSLAVGCANSAAADAVHPSLYSFNDIYRLTVSGPLLAPVGASLPDAGANAVHVARVEPAAAEFRFTITPVPGPGRWPLLLAGLAAAAWVAHRRLTRPL